MDTFSKTDAQCLIYSTIKGTNQSTLIGKTEIVWDSLNPDFTTSFKIDFIFESHQYFKIEVRDIDDKVGKVFEAMGFIEFELASLMGSKNGMLIKDLSHNNKKMGKIVLRSETVAKENYTLMFQPKGFKLTNFGMFSSISPMIQIYKPKLTQQVKQYLETGDTDITNFKQIHSGDWIKVYQSPKMMGSNCMFPYIKISSSKLCGGNMNLPIKVALLNFKNNGSHKWKGEFICRASDLGQGASKQHDLFNNRKKKSAGKLCFMNFSKQLNFKFVDYLKGGMNISIITCVDFTGSNGIPSHPSSLHFLNPG